MIWILLVAVVAVIIGFLLWNQDTFTEGPDVAQVKPPPEKVANPVPMEPDAKEAAKREAPEKAHFEYYHKENARKRELTVALSSRILTAKEMDEVLGYGADLFIHMIPHRGGARSGSYNRNELEQRFSQALQAQARLRIYKESLKPKKKAAPKRALTRERKTNKAREGGGSR